jgi:hypothetical protein
MDQLGQEAQHCKTGGAKTLPGPRALGKLEKAVTYRGSQAELIAREIHRDPGRGTPFQRLRRYRWVSTGKGVARLRISYQEAFEGTIEVVCLSQWQFLLLSFVYTLDPCHGLQRTCRHGPWFA